MQTQQQGSGSAHALVDAVATEIRAQRGLAMMTQAEVAQAAGMSRVTLARIETVRRTPDLDQIAGICAALGISPAHLLEQAQRRIPA